MASNPLLQAILVVPVNQNQAERLSAACQRDLAALFFCGNVFLAVRKDQQLRDENERQIFSHIGAARVKP